MVKIDLSDGLDDELRAAAKHWRYLRRRWIPAIKSMLTSVIDIVGDWVFYNWVEKSAHEFDKYLGPLYFFCCVSTIFGIITFLSLGIGGFLHSERAKRIVARLHYVLGLELFVEDIPQLVLTAMVVRDKNHGWTGVAVFNVTTSAFNLLFNILDMLMPLDEEHHENGGSKLQPNQMLIHAQDAPDKMV